MDNRPKTFDISAPSSPSPTSRPIIVGHQPMMSDPMMRPNSASNQTDEPAPATVHRAKVIAVSDEMRQNLAQPQPEQAPPPVESTLPPVSTPEVPAAPMYAAQTLVDHEAHNPAIAQTPAPSTAPTTPPVEAAVAPAPEPNLSNLPHVPVSHSHSNHPAGTSGILAWLAVAAILIAFAVYLLMDVGLISGGSSLPLRIFGQ